MTIFEIVDDSDSESVSSVNSKKSISDSFKGFFGMQEK
uniref:Uncharacterized protein n=1 Tax=viral metagenome TaxID=1070528 RepID=A0A6C0ADE9_9ZZZZ